MDKGSLERRLIEEHRAFCNECLKHVSEWTNEADALTAFIEHRKEMHHNDSA